MPGVSGARPEPNQQSKEGDKDQQVEVKPEESKPEESKPEEVKPDEVKP